MKKIASIVSIGGWNQRLFTPDWVSANVFEMPAGESMNINLNDKQLTMSYSWKNIQFTATDKGIELISIDCTSESTKLIDKVYRHLLEMLPYTPVSAYGYNIILSLTKEEFNKTAVYSHVPFNSFDIYKSASHSFSIFKDGSTRTFEIRPNGSGAEIRCNFHFANNCAFPSEGTIFDIISAELNTFLGYEFSL